MFSTQIEPRDRYPTQNPRKISKEQLSEIQKPPLANQRNSCEVRHCPRENTGVPRQRHIDSHQQGHPPIQSACAGRPSSSAYRPKNGAKMGFRLSRWTWLILPNCTHAASALLAVPSTRAQLPCTSPELNHHHPQKLPPFRLVARDTDAPGPAPTWTRIRGLRAYAHLRARHETQSERLGQDQSQDWNHPRRSKCFSAGFRRIASGIHQMHANA